MCACEVASKTGACLPQDQLDTFNLEFDLDTCPPFSGSIHFVGCEHYLNAPIDGDNYHTSMDSLMKYEIDTNVCVNGVNAYKPQSVTIPASLENYKIFNGDETNEDIIQSK